MKLFRTYETIDSTNKEAARLLASGRVFHGLTLLADQQTEGRGQYGRQWHAEPGNHLAMSIILLPENMSPADLPALSLKVNLAIVRALKTLFPLIHPEIKWPNDIYVNDKKLAGILIENNLTTGKVQHAIIGIGMNINETAFPSSIPNAISLRMITTSVHNITEIAKLIRQHVIDLIDQNSNEWKKEYDAVIFQLGKTTRFEDKENIFEATITGVDLDGKIILQKADEMKSYFAHEIKWVL